MAVVQIGGVFDWFADAAGDAWSVASDAGDAFLSAAGEVPGFRQLAEIAGDFARTPTGITVFRAMSSSLYGSPLFAVLGPQLASITWAMPGLLRGEKFEKAWFDEVRYRSEKTAEIMGFDQLFGQQLAMLTAEVEKQIGTNGALKMVAEELARRFGVRVDVADTFLAILRSQVAGGYVAPSPASDFDPMTGRRRVAIVRDLEGAANLSADLERHARFVAALNPKAAIVRDSGEASSLSSDVARQALFADAVRSAEGLSAAPRRLADAPTSTAEKIARVAAVGGVGALGALLILRYVR